MTDQHQQITIPGLARLPLQPYPGLRAFESSEWAIFFGREPMIDEVISRLLSRQIIVVHGASGCGKSSLIRAGVLPALELEAARGDTTWKTASMRPADRPLDNLSIALAKSLGIPPEQETSLVLAMTGETPPREALEATAKTLQVPLQEFLKRAELTKHRAALAQETADPAADAWYQLVAVGGAHDAIGRLLLPDVRFCLLIDQFEELFRFAREGGREEAEQFVELICDHANSPIPGLFLILTMRSDYIGMCAQFDRFAEVVDRCQYLLPRMDNLALLRAICEPAQLYGGRIENPVANRLLSAARREEDSLPILQHTLMRASARARERHAEGDGWTVTAEDLRDVEGKDGAGALSTHAEEVFRRATEGNRELMRIAEWVFRSLADKDSQGRIVRRPCRLGDLVKIANTKPEDMNKLIETFRARDCSFLMPPPDEDLSADTVVDVGHEALLRQWSRLSDETQDPETREPKGWLPREIEDGRQWQFLTTMARAFTRAPGATLPPAITTRYDGWLSSHNQAWAERYARQREDAAREYDEVEKLLQASRRKAQWEQLWGLTRLCSIPGLVTLILFLLWGFAGSAKISDVSIAGAIGTCGALVYRLTIVFLSWHRFPTNVFRNYSAPSQLNVLTQTILPMILGMLLGSFFRIDFTELSFLPLATFYMGIFAAEAVDLIRMASTRKSKPSAN
jgi:energy-coupling factor transporter ATP-binding protein EcfA2